MGYPTPKRIGGEWKVDLRAWGFGWHYKLGPDTLPETLAIHLAWAKLEALRGAAAPPGGGQARRASESPPQLSGVVEALERVKTWDSTNGKAWWVKYARIVRRELGTVALADLCRPGGQELLAGYLKRCEARALAARSIRARFCILGQALEFAADPHERQWIPYVPHMPKMPPLPTPMFNWIGERDFRSGRARLYENTSRGHLQRVSGIDPDLYIERRKVYLSWGYYTGQRQEELDHLTGDHAGLDVGTYLAFSHKTGAAVEQWEMPEPLILDLRAYLAFVGRDYFQAGEPIGGGPWKTCSETITRLYGRAVGPRILRRSFARRMFELGYEEKEVVDRMGHVDRRMVHEIYARTPRALGSARSRWRALPEHTLPGPVGPNVIQFPGTTGADDRE